MNSSTDGNNNDGGDMDPSRNDVQPLDANGDGEVTASNGPTGQIQWIQCQRKISNSSLQ